MGSSAAMDAGRVSVGSSGVQEWSGASVGWGQGKLGLQKEAWCIGSWGAEGVRSFSVVCGWGAEGVWRWGNRGAGGVRFSQVPQLGR